MLRSVYIPAGAHLHDRETFTLTSLDVSNQFVLLASTPLSGSVQLAIEGGGFQRESSAWQIDSGNAKKIKWDGLGLAGILAAGDVLVAKYRKEP